MSVTLLSAVRKSAKPGTWSEGVRLARGGNVVLVDRSEAEATLRVPSGGRAVVPTVVLYLGEDLEWCCDCDSPMDPCAHVVAAAIALSEDDGTKTAAFGHPAQAPVAGTSVAGTPVAGTSVAGTSVAGTSVAGTPVAGTPVAGTSVEGGAGEASSLVEGRRVAGAARVAGTARPARRHLGYRLLREPSGLSLSRVLVSSSEEVLIRTALSHPSMAAVTRELMPRAEDIALDRLIGPSPGRYRVLPTLKAVLTALVGAADLKLDGVEVQVCLEPVTPRARVTTERGVTELSFSADPRVDEVVAPGLVRLGMQLCPLAGTEITGLRLEKLPLVRRFTSEQLGELVGKVLPELDRIMVVEIATDTLPGRSRTLKPRAWFDVVDESGILVVTASIVYGEPPTARVERGRLVQLGECVPRRDPAAETTLGLELREQLDLLLERPLRLEGIDAARFMVRMRTWQARHGEAKASKPASEAPLLEPRWLMLDDAPSIVFVRVNEPALVGEELARRAVRLSVVLSAHAEGIDSVPLPDGGWGRLPTGLLETHGQTLVDFVAARDAAGAKSAVAHLMAGRACGELGLGTPSLLPEFARLWEVVSSGNQPSSAADEAPSDIDQGLWSTLRPYQREGVRWLQARRRAGLGAILADDMGLGKTLQALAVMSGRVLVVLPRSVLFNWQSELGRFRPDLTVAVYHGRSRALLEEAHVTLTTYAVLRLDSEELGQIAWDMIVLDEAQNIKNPDSQSAQAAHQLRSGFRLALTGTPIENRLEDLWSEMRFALPGLLGTLSRFRERFVAPIGAGDEDAGARLRRLSAPFVLRRLKSQVAPELPPRTEDILWVELDETERARYHLLETTARAEVAAEGGANASVMDMLARILRLRQAACHLGLLPGEEREDSSKLDRLVESLDEVVAERQRALVFSQWTSLLDRAEPCLRQHGIRFLRLDGATQHREQVVEAFQDPEGPPVLLISLKAGGTGLNLTAADHVFLLDPWWNPTTEAQAADRAHRIGRERPVFIHRLVTCDTIEERIMALKEKKQALAAFADGAEPGEGIGREELLELLG